MKISKKYILYAVMVLLLVVPINLSDKRSVIIGQELKISAPYYDLTGSVITLNDGVYDPFETAANILVDELNPNYTWEQVKNSNEWCTGSGTLQDPYIIQNVSIDGEMYGSSSPYYSPILIRNSMKYFIIQSCSVIRSGDQKHNGGIRMENVTNGVIIKNTLNYNMAGLYLKNCSGNIVTLNTMDSDFNYTKIDDGSVFSNSTFGSAWAVQVQDSYNNIIRLNDIHNYFEGIRVHSSTYHTIHSNTIIIDKFGTVGDGGIILTQCNYTTIANNTLVGVGGQFGVGESDSIGNIIEDNTYIGYNIGPITSSPESSSITLDGSSHNMVRENWIFKSYQDYLAHINGQDPINMIIIISVVSGGLVLVSVAIYLATKKRNS